MTMTDTIETTAYLADLRDEYLRSLGQDLITGWMGEDTRGVILERTSSIETVLRMLGEGAVEYRDDLPGKRYRYDAPKVREWGRQHGYQVGSRGPIPRAVRSAYSVELVH